MADDTSSTATPGTDSTLIDGAKETASSALDTAIDETKSFFSKAQETLTQAAETAVNAVKEHPIAAAGIAAGAAAAVAGAAYGASKLLSDDDQATAGSKAAKSKS